MTQIGNLLEILRTLIMSTNENTINISKETLFDIQICLQHTQEKIDFLQLESQLQQDELQ